MPAINMSDEDIKVLAIYLHDVVRTSRGQGSPPRESMPVTNTVVGDVATGKRYFDAKCSSCHSATGDLANIGNRMPDGKALQNLWVSGGSVGGRGRGRGTAPDRRTPTVTVTLPSGAVVQGILANIDDFNVIVLLQDGTIRTIRRDAQTKVDVKDPMAPHIAPLFLAPIVLQGQGVRSLDPAELLKPLGEEWLTHNGDYSGRRHSSLTQINQATVKNLTLAWFARFTSGTGPRLITGGRGAGDFPPGNVGFQSSALMVDGTIYISAPDNAWAVDARTGREIWVVGSFEIRVHKGGYA